MRQGARIAIGAGLLLLVSLWLGATTARATGAADIDDQAGILTADIPAIAQATAKAPFKVAVLTRFGLDGGEEALKTLVRDKATSMGDNSVLIGIDSESLYYFIKSTQGANLAQEDIQSALDSGPSDLFDQNEWGKGVVQLINNLTIKAQGGTIPATTAPDTATTAPARPTKAPARATTAPARATTAPVRATTAAAPATTAPAQATTAPASGGSIIPTLDPGTVSTIIDTPGTISSSNSSSNSNKGLGAAVLIGICLVVLAGIIGLVVFLARRGRKKPPVYPVQPQYPMQNQGYGNPPYGAPPNNGGYANPPQGYGTPQYGQPPNPGYGNQPNPQYGQPQNPGYGTPPNPQYGQPPNSGYGNQPYGNPPQNPQYGQPQYGTPPNNPPYGTPPNPQYGQPPQNGGYSPPESGYAAPVDKTQIINDGGQNNGGRG